MYSSEFLFANLHNKILWLSDPQLGMDNTGVNSIPIFLAGLQVSVVSRLQMVKISWSVMWILTTWLKRHPLSLQYQEGWGLSRLPW